jgi:site-specific recombinase XerD
LIELYTILSWNKIFLQFLQTFNAHPHVLRHTRAMELVRAGVPLTIVQQILGHSNLNTTAVYLQFSGQEAKAILKERGLI